jgi:hypothetical protein
MVPTTGCRAEAEQGLLGDDDRRNQKTARLLLYEAERNSLNRLDADPEYQGLVEACRVCMRAAGVPAADSTKLPAAKGKD